MSIICLHRHPLRLHHDIQNESRSEFSRRRAGFFASKRQRASIHRREDQHQYITTRANRAAHFDFFLLWLWFKNSATCDCSCYPCNAVRCLSMRELKTLTWRGWNFTPTRRLTSRVLQSCYRESLLAQLCNGMGLPRANKTHFSLI